jgi:hypothetical protein
MTVRESPVDNRDGRPSIATQAARRLEVRRADTSGEQPERRVSARVIPPGLGTRDHATSQPDQSAQPAMATAVVDGLPAMLRVDPVLDQVAGLGLDHGLVHGGVPFRLGPLGARLLVAPCHFFNEHPRVDTTPRRGFPRATSGMPVHHWTVEDARSRRPGARTPRDRVRDAFRPGSFVLETPMNTRST